jgi:hypothetical protein
MPPIPATHPGASPRHAGARHAAEPADERALARDAFAAAGVAPLLDPATSREREGRWT